MIPLVWNPIKELTYQGHDSRGGIRTRKRRAYETRLEPGSSAAS